MDTHTQDKTIKKKKKPYNSNACAVHKFFLIFLYHKYCKQWLNVICKFFKKKSLIHIFSLFSLHSDKSMRTRLISIKYNASSVVFVVILDVVVFVVVLVFLFVAVVVISLVVVVFVVVVCEHSGAME